MADYKYEDWLRPENLIRIEGWARDGLKYDQIAKNMGVACSTLRKWRDEHEAISAALKRGRDTADREVENALFKRALGYTCVETTHELSNEGIMVETRRITKTIPPDTTAQIFWLKNRKPAEWRDKKDVAVEGQIPVVIADNVQS